jgi:hypothetical protein
LNGLNGARQFRTGTRKDPGRATGRAVTFGQQSLDRHVDDSNPEVSVPQAVDNTVAGSATAAEGGVTNAESYTVSGSYQRPRLALTFRGMTYHGRTVDGTFQGDYGSVAGISGMLHLTATGYSKDIDLLLQEPL